MTGEQENNGEPDGEEQELPPFDFNLLVLSLNATALMQLGEASGDEPASPVNLGHARQTIDMLSVLELKTRGNLTGEEERLLHDVLFDLRMRYARRSK